VSPTVSDSPSRAPAVSDLSATEPVRVLFLGGVGRSGSTIVANAAGQHPQTVSIGELVHLWQRGLIDNELCGCGARLRECPFWSEVGAEAFGGWETLDLEAVLALQRSVDRNRYVPLMVRPEPSPRYRRSLTEYAGLLSRLYRAISTVSGAPVIIDSTKHVSFAYLLRRVPGIDVRVAHLVREPEGVAYSWAKKVRRPEAVDRADDMPRYTPARTSGKWLAYNSALHGLGLLGTPTRLFRYEDLMADPRTQIASLLELAGLQPGPLPHLGDDWVELGTSHTIAGNPARFRQGRVELRTDRAWTTEMDPSDRRKVSLLTWPLRTAYGYRRGGPR